MKTIESDYQRAYDLFHKIINQLQDYDEEKGFSKTMYIRSWNAIVYKRDVSLSDHKFSDGTVGYLSLTDILDDAMELGYITTEEYYLIYTHFNY